MSSETILLVDDSPDDVLLIRLALARAGIPHKLMVVSDGEKALRYLRGESPFADRAAFPLPKLVFLDLAMPRTGGFEILEWVRRQPQFNQLPVVVLTGSALLADSKRAYELGASSFVTKPADLTELTLALKEVAQSWLSLTPSSVAESAAKINPPPAPGANKS
jgi:CheY-like chemotaxis protein